MKTPRIVNAVGHIDDELVSEAADGKKTAKNRAWLKFLPVAACFALIVSAIVIIPTFREPKVPIIDDPIDTTKSAVESTTADDSTKEEDDTTEPPEALFAPYTFASFEEFEKHEKEAGEKGVSYYYIPSALTEYYRLSQITKRDDVYVTVEYTLDLNNTENPSDYDAERLSTLICQYSLYSDGKKALESGYIKNGFEPIEYEGKTYYRWDEHAENNPDKQIVGYEIAFLEDGELIFMHLPAVDTFENMMKHANLIKVSID